MRLPRVHLASLALLLTFSILVPLATATEKPMAPRRVVSLDGTWQIEQGSLETVPPTFTHSVVVPGLVDMAQPAFQEVGKKSSLRQAFWYRRTFTLDGPVAERTLLKIHKAKHGTKVFLNGNLVGEHLPCFTPAYFDVARHLRGNGQENELVIRLGADRESLPDGMPTGWDFEKYLFIPGIYDSVELILSGTPYISNVQPVPDTDANTVRIVTEIQTGQKPADVALKAEVVEARSGSVVGSAAAPAVSLAANQQKQVELTIPIAHCRLWSPEDPFLYEVRLTTGADAVKVRFGMRSFRFDPKTKRAMLNGKPYFMRGSNICIYRFFEDAERGELPWSADWVRRLHQKVKSMHWNSLRYCIGFPPEFWYDIADEEGILIQDEFPIWLLSKAPESPKAEMIIPEYTEWMRERWNHPCVVIWDAQNESNTDETGEALQAVRHLDLSNRPWENGWSEPQSETDCVESHPYLFIGLFFGNKTFRMSQMPEVSGVPTLNPRQKKLSVPIIINEYAWLWLNRDGTPTCLTEKVYNYLLGPNSTTEQRRQLYARYLAAKTEFWRCHRECAGVLHFCTLGYSRAGDKPRPEGGATSDHFVDLKNLTLEPNFEKYVKDAFAPVGLMLDFWAEEVPVGSEQPLKVFAINDLGHDWQGTLRLRLVQGDREVSTESRSLTIAAVGREIVSFTQAIPNAPGNYTLVAELVDGHGKATRSLRDFQVKAK